MARAGEPQRSVGGVMDPDHEVQAARRQPGAVRAPHQCQHRHTGTPERESLLAGGRVPDPDRPVRAARR
jgi:hypothetical protein